MMPKQLYEVSIHFKICSSGYLIFMQFSAICTNNYLALLQSPYSQKWLAQINITAALAFVEFVYYTCSSLSISSHFFYYNAVSPFDYIMFYCELFILISSSLQYSINRFIYYIDYILVILYIANQQYYNFYNDNKMSEAFQIFEQQSSEFDSALKSQSTSQVRSYSSSKVSKASSSIAEVARVQLLNYQDVCENDFIIIPNEKSGESKDFRESISSQKQYSSYLHCYGTSVPIGSTHQAVIPSIVTCQRYRSTHALKIKSIRQRKIHDEAIDSKFYSQYKAMIQTMFGSQRTYQDANFLRIAFIKKSSHPTFQDYIKDDLIMEYWEDYFENKDKIIAKITKKKKKRRTIFKI